MNQFHSFIWMNTFLVGHEMSHFQNIFPYSHIEVKFATILQSSRSFSGNLLPMLFSTFVCINVVCYWWIYFISEARITEFESQPARLHGLAKVHKSGTLLRPVLSIPGSSYENLNKFLSPFFERLPGLTLNRKMPEPL